MRTLSAYPDSEPALLSLAVNTNAKPIDSQLGFKIIDSQSGLKEIFETIEGLGKDEGVVIKMQTWRGDDVGIKAAEACSQALSRGADVKLFKDHIGATFEFGEREGHSFWHEFGEKKLLDWQGNLIQKFYSNSEINRSQEQSELLRDLREQLNGFSQFDMEDTYRYDHSKVIIIYDKKKKQPLKAFVGGACFGDEWGDQVIDQNFDGVVCVTDPIILKQLVSSLKGQAAGWKDGVKILTNAQQDPESYYHTVRQEVLACSGAIEAAIAYMGKADFIQLFEGKEEATLIMPFEANINRDRNWHFIYEMMRRMEKGFSGGVRGRFNDGKFLSYWWDFMDKTNQKLPNNLQVVPLDRMSHLKAIICGQVFASIGSANMVGENAFNEAGIAFKGDSSDKADFGIQQTQFLLQRAKRHSHQERGLSSVGINYVRSELEPESQEIRFSLLKSQLEHVSMAFQAMMARLRSSQIKVVQAREAQWFCEMFPDV